MADREAIEMDDGGAVARARHKGVPRTLSVWEASLVIAYKEILVNIRTKRLFIIGGIFLVVFLAVTVLMSYVFKEPLQMLGQFAAEEGFATPSPANLVFGFYLLVPIVGGMTILKLLAISFTFDGIVREYEDKSLFLLLSKPMSRASLVYGKFIGSFGGVAILFLCVAMLGYGLTQLITRDLVTGRELVGYLGALAILVLGMAVYASLSLMSSAIWKSTTVSVIFTLGVLLFALPMVSGIVRFAIILVGGVSAEEPWLVFMTHLDPGFSMKAAVAPLLWSIGLGGEQAGTFVGLLSGGFSPAKTWLAMAMLAGETVLFLGITQWLVARRNFE